MTPIPWIRTILLIAGLLLLGVVVSYAGNLVVLVLIAAILAYLLSPFVNAIERRGVGRTLSATLVFIALSLVLALLVVVMTPIIADQAATLKAQWEAGDLLQLLNRLESELAASLPILEPGSLNLAESAHSLVESQQSKLITYAGDALSIMGDMIVVPFVLFFLLRDGSSIRKKLVSLVPNRYFEFTMGVLYKIDDSLGSYLRGQSLVALVVGVLTALGLGFLGVDYYLMLGLITGIANFIPYVGFVISALLTIGVSIFTTGGFGQVLWIVVIFGIVQTLENVVLQPFITGRNVSLHPVSVLLAILIGGKIGGVLGMALAVPTVAILKVIVVETVVTLRRYRLS
ncbi:MAG: AI-2E family transporter [Rubricoccaceae bacterium]|nr:AI-2E family transporter [Rubricoccaceae bacterium]